MAMTLEQQRALAIAGARMKAAQAQGGAQSGDGGAVDQNTDTLSKVRTASGGFLEGIPVVGPMIRGGVERAAAATLAPFSDMEYGDILKRIQAGSQAEKAANPVLDTGSQIAGAVAGTAPLVMAAPAAFGVSKAPMLARMGASASSGAGLGGADIAVRGGDASGIALGAGIGSLAGGIAPPVAAAAQRAGGMIGGMLGVGNAGRAKQAIAEALMRSGRTADDVARDMTQAAAEGQGGYALADALGNSGQRMLSGVARSPGDMRQVIAEALDARQAGQGRRVSTFLDEAFGSADGTALQKQAAQKATRRAEANVNYGAARSAAGAVDTTPAIRAIDDVIRPGVTPITGAGANDGGVYSTLSKARSFLTNGKAQVSDFDRALLAKQEMDSMIEKGGQTAALLRPARDALDDALAQASEPYARARDVYRAHSKAMEAVDIGRNAARRGRFEDTTAAFSRMSPQEQAGFRTGYADPLIENAQGSAVGVNKARPLINDATAIEFPAFAGEGKGARLARQLARENTMFETRSAALGGSRTADNLADIADVGTFDPTIIGNLLGGNIKGAALNAISKSANALQGRNQATRDMIALTLLKTAPTQATADIVQALAQGRRIDARQAAIIRALIAGSLPIARTATGSE